MNGHAQRPRGTVRVGAIDMGSNTTRLEIADVTRDDHGRVTHTPVVRTSTITRLAEQVDARGILLPQAIARTRNALTACNRMVREHGVVFVLATATSAVRDADNGEAFLGEVEYTYGFRTMLLSGEEEAATTFRGVTSDETLAHRAAEGTGFLIDIGGGSTEIVLSDRGELRDHESFQMGSVRLTERHLADADPPGEAALERARADAKTLLTERFADTGQPDLAVAVAGTATTLAAMQHELREYDPTVVHGSTVTAGEVREHARRLANMPLAEREHVVGLEPRRAPVIVGGLAILEAALDHFGIGQFVVSEADILDGIALRAGEIALDEGITELPEPFGRTVC